MDEILFARHGESETSARDRRRRRTADRAWTPPGARARSEARVVPGRGLPDERGAPGLRDRGARARDEQRPDRGRPELGDIRFGAFDGRPLAEYRDWVAAHSPTAAPPGGESRVETLRRFAHAFRSILTVERLTRVTLEQAVRRLERWCESPAW